MNARHFLLSFILFCSLHADNPYQPHTKEKKPWTFIIYAAADNNLRDFAPRNIKQMMSVGSNDYVNILVHLDIRLIGNKKTTRRYYIEHNQVIQVNPGDEHTPPMDSGDPKTLVSTVAWATSHYPADHYALLLWNHGTGVIDPLGGRLLNTQDLFFYNPESNTFDLDRTFGFLDLIDMLNYDPKGICWDETTGNYLTNQKLEIALTEACNTYLNSNKFDIIGFDACLMSMLEISEIVKKFAHIQISSQEVEPGPGWDYSMVFAPFVGQLPDAESIAKNIVQSYAAAYHKITRDYTLSAIRLSEISSLEENINRLAELLLSLLSSDPQNIIKQLIRISKSNSHCTHFDEPSYKDLYHFYSNLEEQLVRAKGKLKSQQQILSEVFATLSRGKAIMQHAIIANVSGPNLPKATGISIYFPERKVHPSYRKTTFAQNNKWVELVTKLLIG